MLYYYRQHISWRRWARRGGLTLAWLALPAAGAGRRGRRDRRLPGRHRHPV